MGLYDKGGGARTLEEYLQKLGREDVGEGDLVLLACTVSASTTNFSIRDCLLANNSAPFPAIVGPSPARLIPLSETRPFREDCDAFDAWTYDFPAGGGQEATECGALSDLFLEGEGGWCGL